MEKVFEDYFSELQTDMVVICLEYAHKKADNIYIYGSVEDNIFSVGFFYKINGKLLKRHEINKENLDCDVSIIMQKKVMQILLNNLKEIQKLFIKHEREMPTEIKMIYDVHKNSLNAKYKYEKIISVDSSITARDIEQKWFEEFRS